MNKLSIRCILCILLFWGKIAVKAQDIESVAKAPVLVSNGGISFSQIFNHTPGEANQTKDPYAYYLSGNLNLNFFSVVNIPMSFAYTNQQLNSNISLPFNRFSIAPSYKWVKVYAGYSSMHFSPYTLAGHEIFGGGVEISPDIGLRVSAVYGRLKKATGETAGMDPSYKRMGGGLKVEYTFKYADVGVNIFKAKDDPHSIHFRNPDSISVNPQDNLSGSAFINLKISENLRFSTEYAVSALSWDISRSDTAGNRGIIPDKDADRAVYYAIRSNISQTSVIGTIGATYERVSPNYNTLGAYYMLNDFENITANFSTSVKSVNIALDGGYQRDNLNKQKNNTTSRIIYSGNVSTTVGQKLNLGAHFSNIQSYIHIRDIYDQITQTNEFQNLDTLNFTQLNYTMGVNSSYLLQSTQAQRQSINVNFMYQKAAEKQENTSYSGNNIYNSTLGYQYSQIPRKLNASASVNYNHHKMPESYTGTLSCNISVQKVFFEKLKAGIICTYSDMFNNERNLAKVVNLRITGGYTLQKRHNFNLSVAMVHNNGQNKTLTQYSANLSYSYIFGFSVLRKDKKMQMNYEL